MPTGMRRSAFAQNEPAVAQRPVEHPAISGATSARAAAQRPVRVPHFGCSRYCVLVSGHALPSEVKKVPSLGSIAWVPKPPTLDRLAHVIARLLQGKATE